MCHPSCQIREPVAIFIQGCIPSAHIETSLVDLYPNRNLLSSCPFRRQHARILRGLRQADMHGCVCVAHRNTTARSRMSSTNQKQGLLSRGGTTKVVRSNPATRIHTRCTTHVRVFICILNNYRVIWCRTWKPGTLLKKESFVKRSVCTTASYVSKLR
jgi:hypothetical protein